MICPYYKNSEVFNGFNEMIEALGGKPMTEEEFRNPELRNLRSGADYSAMEATYRIYNRNGGNMLDMTPLGKPSVLFQTLLNHFDGDRAKAIIAKSNVYSDEFFNWFGDWTSEEKNNVSKVVDENGEPFVVYHNTRALFDEFDKKYIRTADGFFFTVDNTPMKVFGDKLIPVYLNVKNLKETDSTMPTGDDFNYQNDGFDGMLYFFMDSESFIIPNPNQIKHVENLGTWNPNDPNIYKSTIDNTVDVDDSNIFKSTNLVDSFGNELATKLLNGLTVSSKDLMNAMISNGVFHPGLFKLAELMSKHDVPVRISNDMGVGDLAETITDRGGSVILLNPKEVYNISRGYFGTTMIHELVHAVTVDIIDNPKTDEERAFVEQNRAVFLKLNTYFRKDGAIKFDALSGLHVLDNEKEFAAYFASDPNVRKNIFDLADAMDRGTKRGLFKRIQRLLNKFISAFISRSNIKELSTREQVQEYEKALEDFLYDRPFIQKGNISSKSYLKAVYAEQNGAITNHENFIESMKLLELMTTAQKNFVKLGNESYNILIGKHKPGSVQITSWEEVKNSLSTRINALRGSNMDSVVKSRLLQITQNQLEMFAIDEAGKFLAIQNLLDTSIPQIIKDIENLKTIRRENGVFSNDDYMYHMHANLGMYNRVFDGIKKLIDDDHNRQEMVDAFNANVIREEDKITVEDINEIERHLDNAKNFTEEGMNVVEYMLKENVIDKLKRIGNETGNPEMGDYINALNSTLASDMIDDIGQLESMAGSADSSTNEAVRTIAYMINKALTAATMNSAGKATDLLKLKENLKRGEHEWDIYETDEKGNFTGYLIRDLNFGRFYRDYQNEIRKINQDIRDLFDIPDLDLDHRTAPDIKKQVMINGVLMTPKEFFDNRKEDWLEKHAERRYKPEYYKQYSNLPQRVKDSLGEIRIQINAITQNYTDLYDDNGVPHYEKLSDEDWDKINVLWERRRSLRSDYDEYGNLKKGQDLEDARKLRELYETLYYNNADGSKKDKKYDKTGWLKARNEIKSKYGEDSEELRTWDERNSRKTLKKNSYGETIVFKKIEEEVGGRPSYGDEYEQLSKERTEHLNNYRLANGEVDANAMPDVIKNIVRKIDLKMSDIRAEKRASDKDGFRKFADDYREVKDKYIRYVNTKQFEKILKAIEEEAKRRVAEAADDPLDPATKEDYMYAMLSGVYGEYKSYSDDLLGGEEFHPYSWLLTIEAIDEQYMDIQPNDAWIDKKDNDLLNPNFNEDYGTAWVPKRSLYDNSAKYNQIFGEGGSKTLLDLYNGVKLTLVEANDMYGRQYADNFLLPQKECTFLGRLRRKPFWAGVWYYIKRITSLGRSKKEDDVSTLGSGKLVGRYDDPNDTEIGQSVQEDINGNYNKVRGTYPDGRSFHIIPQYFSKRMKHPEYISRDVVDITASYYRMAEMYKQRSLVRNDCEAILDVLQRLQFSIGDGRTIGGIGNTESNTYKYAKDIIERDLYDIQRLPLSITMAGKTYDFGRILGLWKRWTTARNLGMNPKVAIVGFLTTSFTHILNGAVGYKYGRHEMWRANNIVLKEFGRSIFSEGTFIGSRLTKNRVMLLLEMMDMSDQLERKTEHSNRNRWLLAIYKNSTFGLLSAADISSKAVIAVSTFLSYRYVNGEFLTKHQIEESREAFGEDYDKIMEEFKNSKVTLYDIFIDGDEKLQVDPKYQEAWDKVKNTAINKSIKNAEQADGMATRLLKAMMTRNFIGALALIHRQYIPLMIRQTWGKRVFDMDAEEYKDAQFRTMYNYLCRVLASNALASFGVGAFCGVALGGFGVIPLYTGITALVISLAKKASGKHERKSLNESLRDKEFFHASGSAKARANSLANRYQVKQTILEVALINCFIAPLANLFSCMADGWDKNDELTRKILQWIAYFFRAFQFESNAKYNIADLNNNIQTLTAATSVTSGILDVVSNTTANILFTGMYGANTARSTVRDIYEIYDEHQRAKSDDVIQRSKTYKGWTTLLRDLFKLTPWHNAVEQYMDPEGKRRYQENKVMRMNKQDKRSFFYDLFKGECKLFDIIDYV